ncbi:hypothetical protein D3C76_1659490 [compost metagenome]
MQQLLLGARTGPGYVPEELGQGEEQALTVDVIIDGQFGTQVQPVTDELNSPIEFLGDITDDALARFTRPGEFRMKGGLLQRRNSHKH